MMSSSLPEKQLLCPLCSLIFTDPVTTPCGHNFCHACLQSAWAKCDNMCQCPTCEKTFSPRPEISINTAFKELADTFKSVIIPQKVTLLNSVQPGEITCDVCLAGSVEVKAKKSCLVCLASYCSIHLEPHQKVGALQVHKLIEPVGNLQERLCKKHDRLLEMFCKDEQKCVCRFCVETEHKNHKAVSLEDESAERKAQMVKTEAEFKNMIEQRVKKVEEISNSLQQRKESADKELEHSDTLFTSLINSIKERQTEVKEAILKEQRSAETRAEQLTQDLNREIQELETRRQELEELRESDDHLQLIQRFPSVTVPPVSTDWSEVRLPSEQSAATLRDALSKLKETVDKQMDLLRNQELRMVQKYAVDVELDPHTAHPNIVLSPDGKQAGRGELLHIVPDNPQRFDPVICVLAKKGYVSGRFYFQVSVGSKTYWDLGVVLESVNRKGMITSKPENGFWTVRLRGGDEYRALDSPSVLLKLHTRPQTVGVFTDYDQGTVSFYDVGSRTLLYCFTGCAFAERVFPFFSPGVCDDGKNVAPLIVVPVKPER
ncbi:E3 ubiquitin-protein ligase TRIM39-like [Boleophthalmus pectinirostris]|uniref:E3 ubiquitin-protein ligase TRIM39-like n=1 Tax=Boleophthalmus pectinirostris TaxID=150288 RepID=UPI00242B18D2|nr:E3 ubiquitin-protein ligase TRIM39-like [Boleophthalmus pectinirostris]